MGERGGGRYGYENGGDGCLWWLDLGWAKVPRGKASEGVVAARWWLSWVCDAPEWRGRTGALLLHCLLGTAPSFKRPRLCEIVTFHPLGTARPARLPAAVSPSRPPTPTPPLVDSRVAPPRQVLACSQLSAPPTRLCPAPPSTSERRLTGRIFMHAYLQCAHTSRTSSRRSITIAVNDKPPPLCP